MNKDSKPIIEISNLVKVFKQKHKGTGVKGSLKSLFRPKYKEFVAVDNISFSLNKGEIVGFIGPNGAGKSTTIKMLTGILFPTSGSMKVLGMVPWDKRKKLAYEIGSVFGQKPQLWYHLPAIETFNLFSKIYELDDKKYKTRLNYLVDKFELRELLDIPVRKLSLGQRMRCEIVAALLHEPKVLFLDEPTIGLDVVAKQKIRELIIEMNKKEKVTILLTSHDMQDIEHLCDRIIVINHGKVIYDGDIKKMQKDYLQTKIISVKFGSEFNSIKHIGVKTISHNKYSAEFELSTKDVSIQKFISYLMEKYNILDLTIKESPIEEVITKIYMEK